MEFETAYHQYSHKLSAYTMVITNIICLSWFWRMVGAGLVFTGVLLNTFGVFHHAQGHPYLTLRQSPSSILFHNVGKDLKNGARGQNRDGSPMLADNAGSGLPTRRNLHIDDRTLGSNEYAKGSGSLTTTQEQHNQIKGHFVRTATGRILRIDGSLLFLEETNEKRVILHFDHQTKVQGHIQPGINVEVDIGHAGYAEAIRQVSG